MIPKIIHYCWFGGNPKPELVLKCIESWKKYCPDYEIVEWNESNFDVNCIPYTRDAYAAKKWAFVSDYARLRIVFENGGIYLDTDVELKGNLDELLQYDAWFAQEDIRWIHTGLGFGASIGNELIRRILVAREEREFDMVPNHAIDTPIVVEYLDLKQSKDSRVYRNTYIIGMNEYVRYARHHAFGSWMDSDVKEILAKRRNYKLLWKLKCWLRNPSLIEWLQRNGETRISRVYVLFAYDFLDMGLVYFLKRLIKKIAKKS